MRKRFLIKKIKEEIVKKILFLIFVLMLVNLLNALPVISFKETEHDFGTVKEEAGPLEHKFVFTNTGDEPLKLIKVKST